MKKLVIIALAASVGFVSCTGSDSDVAKTTEQQTVAEHKGATYTVDAATSTLKWTGYHKGGLNPRYGIVNGTGTLAVENNVITGGTYTADLNTIVTDTASVAASEGKKSTELDGHLKSAEFFDVAKYPTATFKITSVGALTDTVGLKFAGATNTVSGNLTLKDKTLNVTFPAKVIVTDNDVSIESQFLINRKDWGLTYGTDGDPKDWGISQDVDIQLNIKAKK